MCCGLYYFMVKSVMDGMRQPVRPDLIDLLQKGGHFFLLVL